VKTRNWPALLLGTGLGVGFFPVAPGTAATLLPAVPLAWWLGEKGLGAALLGAGVLFLTGWWASAVCERSFQRRDPPQVVIDEVVGFLVAVAGLDPRWPVLLAGFFLFRAADILKPWPARLIDRRVPGGLGIMLDDLVAGLYARAALELVVALGGV